MSQASLLYGRSEKEGGGEGGGEAAQAARGRRLDPERLKLQVRLLLHTVDEILG